MTEQDEKLLLTITEELKLRLKWKRLNPSTRISWRDYWLKAQLAKDKKATNALVLESEARGELIRRLTAKLEETLKHRTIQPVPKFNNALEADAHNWDTRELPRPELRVCPHCGKEIGNG